jgi:hypothetical protein
VSRNNVVVNVKSWITAIEKRTGEVRWRLFPREALSSPMVVVDPTLYPKEYGRAWQGLEELFAGTWNGRFQAMVVRGRMYDYVRSSAGSVLSAPEFDLVYNWHRSLSGGRAAVTAAPVLFEDVLYYAADNCYVYSVGRGGLERGAYLLQDLPSTELAVTPSTCFVGARDCYFYALDRLAMKKKWFYAPGVPPTGSIYADEQPDRTPYVFVPIEPEGMHALRITPAEPAGRTTIGSPETFEVAWKMPEAQGVITAGERRIYAGLGRAKDFRGYTGIVAVDKAAGRVHWKSDSAGVRFYLEFHNAYATPAQAMRLYAVTEDNRLLSFKEKAAHVGPVVLAKPAAVPEAPKPPVAPVPPAPPEAVPPAPPAPPAPPEAAPPPPPAPPAPPEGAPPAPPEAAPPAPPAPPEAPPPAGEKTEPPPKAE